MFYYKLLVVFTIATVGLSSPMTKSLNEPERCCAPKQFTSKIIVSIGSISADGKPSAFYAHFNFSFDTTRGLVGMRGISYTKEGQQNLLIIQNVTNGQGYTYDVDIKQCFKSTMPIKIMSCIPETATYVNSLMYGYGDKQIIADTWFFKINETISYSVVSRGDCIPLTGSIFMEQPPLTNGLTTISSEPRITDPSIFDIPSECQKLI